MLFLRLATYLMNHGYDTAILDYADGTMAINKPRSLAFIEYSDLNTVELPTDSILVFQSMTPWSMYPQLKVENSTRLYFITTLPINFYTTLPGLLRSKIYEGGRLAKFIWNTLLRSEFLKVKVFLNLIEAKNSHALLDKDILCNIERSLSVKVRNPHFLPLFSDDVTENEYLKMIKNDEDALVFAWVGRLADFKVSILNKVVRDAYNYTVRNKIKIKFYVVGSGNYAGKVINRKSEYFEIERISYIRPGELDSFMLTLDILFAMGTSALDGAKLGVPTVVLDYSYFEVTDKYLYRYFSEITNYCLAQHVESKCFVNGVHSFSDIVQLLNNNNNSFSVKTLKKYKLHHSISSNSGLLLKYLGSSTLVWGDLEKHKLLQSFIHNVWTSVMKSKVIAAMR